MKAVVLVGGQGTRLRPLTYTTPKPLLPIANVPFIERQLMWLASHGVTEAVLSLGYLPEAFTEHFSEGYFSGIKLRFVVEDEPLGTAGGIRFAADGIDDRVVVCNGDVLTDLDLTAFVNFHIDRGAEATISLAKVDDPSGFGVVPTHDDGEVIAFIEKPPREQAPTNWINAGTYVLEPEVLDRIPARLNVSIERETFPRMLENPGRLYAVQSDSYWLDIGTPQKFFEAHHDVVAGRLGSPPIAGAIARSPGVWVQSGAVIADDAILTAPVLIGERAIVGSGAVVEDSVLGPGVEVSAESTVRHSVLLTNVFLARGSTVNQKVVAVDVSLACDDSA
ncbi:MAG: NDP-sugar synthase [Acidimicrobiia bacterium]|nr:NDP-sugar synthase [Acidimicrobiia bacterium]